MTPNLSTLSEKKSLKEVTGVKVHIFVCMCGCESAWCQRLGKEATSERGIVTSYLLNARSPTQSCFTWGNAAEDNYRLDTQAGQPLPYTVDACKADLGQQHRRPPVLTKPPRWLVQRFVRAGRVAAHARQRNARVCWQSPTCPKSFWHTLTCFISSHHTSPSSCFYCHRFCFCFFKNILIILLIGR